MLKSHKLFQARKLKKKKKCQVMKNEATICPDFAELTSKS